MATAVNIDIRGQISSASNAASSSSTTTSSASSSTQSQSGLSSSLPSSSSTSPPPTPPVLLDTLDEPVLTTILRDITQVGRKIKYVLVPSLAPTAASSNASSGTVGTGGGAHAAAVLQELRNWDLWGPLLLCLALSVLLSSGGGVQDGQSSLVFAWVFVLVWAGAGVVTLNAQLLGGQISFFQSVCVLGYCMCPLVIASALCAVSRSSVWRSALVILGVAWSCRASVVFMSELVPHARRALAVYPVVLFYMIIGWMVYVL